MEENNQLQLKEQSEKQPKSLFAGVIIWEAAALVAVLFVCRMWIFPAMGGNGLLVVDIATHTLGLGILATVGTILWLIGAKKWKTHKKYVAIPVIFTLFGFYMQIIAEEIISFM